MNEDHHRLLIRQLRKLGLDAQHPPDGDAWLKFLTRIDLTYKESDQDRYTLERSLAISSEEMQALYQRQKNSYEARLQTIIEAIPDLMFELDAKGNVLEVWSADTGELTANRSRLQGHKLAEALPERAAEQVMQALREADVVGQSRGQQVQIHTTEGEYWFELSTSLISRETTPHRFLMLSRNITERKQAESRLQLAASVFTHAREAITITDARGNIIEVNDAFTQITGYNHDEVVGRNPRILKSGRQGPEFYNIMWKELLDKGYWSGEIWNRRKNGEVYAEMLTISAVHDESGQVQHYVALFSDISSLKEHQHQLERMAHYDALTGLPNRVLLTDRLHQAMTHAKRRGSRLAVVYLDLDGFKEINDKYGHNVGDELLVAVAAQMKEAMRESDTITRLGGDEFVAILIELATVEDSVQVLNRLLAAAAKPVAVGQLFLRISASLGVTFYPQTDDVDPDQLLRQSDQAMYQAKLAGKNRYHVFDTEKDRFLKDRHENLDHIRYALAQNEFVLHYQPKVNMRSGEIIGMEALVRWEHPKRGLLMPGDFLPAIADHPVNIELGDWVIETAVKQLESWHREGLKLSVSVNIDAQHLQQNDFVARLRKTLAAHPDITSGSLELEVLETSALEDIEHVSGIIYACKEIGVSFTLDDFGTGYSSLTYLRRLPVTSLKIDQSFVRGMLDNPDDLAILEGVLGLASAFHLEPIAEGIETTEHAELLLMLGCELGQGYGIAEPMSASKIQEWIQSWQPAPGWREIRTVDKEDMSLLFGMVEHRGWLRGVKTFLSGNLKVLPPLEEQTCNLCYWIEGNGRERHGNDPVYQDVARLRGRVHVMAQQLADFHARGLSAKTGEVFGELKPLSEALIDSLNRLLQK